jgi:hypothetical protein
MSDQPEVIQPRTDFIELEGQQVEATWFHFFVRGGGNIKVLAANAEAANAIMRARFPDTEFAGGLAKRKPSSGDIYTCQVAVAQYGSEANPKDIAEAKRRGGINYEVRTK